MSKAPHGTTNNDDLRALIRRWRDRANTINSRVMRLSDTIEACAKELEDTLTIWDSAMPDPAPEIEPAPRSMRKCPKCGEMRGRRRDDQEFVCGVCYHVWELTPAPPANKLTPDGQPLPPPPPKVSPASARRRAFRISLDGGGLSSVTLYRSTLEAAQKVVRDGFAIRFGTSHRRGTIHQRQPDGSYRLQHMIQK